MFLLTAIALGFLGSFHCVGMCGPIALALPVKRSSLLRVLTGSLIYNSGRLITYASLGFFFGLFGQGIALAGWQNRLSIASGIIILAVLFAPKFSVLHFGKGLLFRFLEKLKSRMRKLFGIHSAKSLVLIGMLNGLLPCGLVYLGIAGSIATGDFIKGALFMTAFGLGTFPAMVTLTVMKSRISISFREKIRKTIPVLVGMVGVLLILRGMNLGIPFLSPSIEIKSGAVHLECCRK
jgi:uncharacterized protein